MNLQELLHKIRRKWTKLRLQPIRVFCFHHVSNIFDEESMKNIDWLNTEDFKHEIDELLNQGYTFISLSDAYIKLKYDWIRREKYAVLTADDGYATINTILPWLKEKQIPITLFLNPAYLDGIHFRNRDTERYLSHEDVKNFYKNYPNITIGSHGWEHLDATQQSVEDFKFNVAKSIGYLQMLPNFVPFFAFTYGRYTSECVEEIQSFHLVPLMIKGGMNYNNTTWIDRELLGYKFIKNRNNGK